MLVVPRRLAPLVAASAVLLAACSAGAGVDGNLAAGTTTTIDVVSEVGQRRPWDGMILPPPAGNPYDSSAVLIALTELAELGAPNVALVVPLQVDPSTGLPRRGPVATPDDAALGEAMHAAHELGLGVVLQLRLDPPSIGSPRAAPVAWFRAYGDLVVHYAALADHHDAALLVVGSGVDVPPVDAESWTAVLEAAREFYDGPVAFAAEAEFVDEVEFWDAVDVIGVDTDFPAPDVLDPIAADIEKAWEPVMQELTLLAETWSAPVVLTRVGYPGVERTSAGQVGIAEERQLDAYAALFTVVNQTPAIEGILVWRWGTDALTTGDEGATYSPQDRPAEEVLRRAWTTPLAGEDGPDATGEDGVAGEGAATLPGPHPMPVARS